MIRLAMLKQFHDAKTEEDKLVIGGQLIAEEIIDSAIPFKSVLIPHSKMKEQLQKGADSDIAKNNATIKKVLSDYTSRLYEIANSGLITDESILEIVNDVSQNLDYLYEFTDNGELILNTSVYSNIHTHYESLSSRYG